MRSAFSFPSGSLTVASSEEVCSGAWARSAESKLTTTTAGEGNGRDGGETREEGGEGNREGGGVREGKGGR